MEVNEREDKEEVDAVLVEEIFSRLVKFDETLVNLSEQVKHLQDARSGDK